MNDMRKKRLEHAIMEAVSWILIRDIEDPSMGFVTVMGCKIDSEFKTATILYSVIGSEKRLESTKSVLSRAGKLIQRLVANKLELRQMPLLRFQFDPTPSKAQKLENMFKELENEHNQPQADGSGDKADQESDNTDA